MARIDNPQATSAPPRKSLQGGGLAMFMGITEDSLEVWSDAVGAITTLVGASMGDSEALPRRERKKRTRSKRKKRKFRAPLSVPSLVLGGVRRLGGSKRRRRARKARRRSALSKAFSWIGGISIGLLAALVAKVVLDPDGKWKLLLGNFDGISDMLGRSAPLYGYRPFKGEDVATMFAGYEVSSRYGARGGTHRGIDYKMEEGTPIPAIFDGEVIVSGYGHLEGNYIILQSLDGKYQAVYLHLAKERTQSVGADYTQLPVGAKVRKGETLGYSGNTAGGVSKDSQGHGISRVGYHLHLGVKELQRDGTYKYVDPNSINTDTLKSYEYDDDVDLKTGSYVTYGSRGVDVTSTPMPYSGIKQTNVVSNTNNPFSLTASGIDWEGENGTYTAKTGVVFEVFDTMESGLRAGIMNIRGKQTKSDRSDSGGTYITLYDFANNYASPERDDMETYINNLEEFTGYDRHQKIDLRDADTLYNVSNAVMRQESGGHLDKSEFLHIFEKHLSQDRGYNQQSGVSEMLYNSTMAQ